MSADAEDIATNLAKVVNNRESWPGQKIQRSLHRQNPFLLGALHSDEPNGGIGYCLADGFSIRRRLSGQDSLFGVVSAGNAVDV